MRVERLDVMRPLKEIYSKLSSMYSSENTAEGSIHGIIQDIRSTVMRENSNTGGKNKIDVDFILQQMTSPMYEETNNYYGQPVKEILRLVWAAAADPIDHEGNQSNDPGVIESKKLAVIDSLQESQNAFGQNRPSNQSGTITRLLNSLMHMHPLVAPEQGAASDDPSHRP